MNATITTGTVQVRAEICARCATPCENQRRAEFHANPCSSCPLTAPRWRQYGRCKNFGLGDLVAAVAQPIAKTIDAVAGTNVAGCGGCAQRRAALNKLVPDIKL